MLSSINIYEDKFLGDSEVKIQVKEKKEFCKIFNFKNILSFKKV